MNIYLDIFLTFTRIGGLTFGGGYSMLPMLEREVVENRGWATQEEVLDFFSVSQVLPGMIAINAAIFIGNKVKGRLGGILAALGVAFPSLVIIVLIAALISNFVHLPLVQHAFAGVRACVFVLILQSILKLFKGAIVDTFGLVLAIAVFLLSVLTDLNPVLFVLMSAVLGFGMKRLTGGRKA